MEIKFHDVPLKFLSVNRMDAVYQEETSEVIVPDSLPDVERIVDVQGTLLLRSRELSAGTCTAGGGVQVIVLYLPEDGTELKRVETYITFKARRDVPETEDGTVQCRSWLRSLDARTINSRKLLIRANIGSEFQVFSGQEIGLPEPEGVPEFLQLRRNQYELLLPQCCGEKEFQINDELDLPDNTPGIRALLTKQIKPVVEEWKMIGNKAVFKGRLELRLLYKDAEGGLHTWQDSMPFSQYAELTEELDDADLILQEALTAAEIDTDGQADSHCLVVNCGVLMQITVLAKQSVTLIDDAYTTRGGLEPAWDRFSIQAMLDLQKNRESGSISIPVAAAEIIERRVYTDNVTVRREADRVWLTAPVTASIFYCDENRQLRNKTARGELTCETVLAADGLCRAVARIVDVRATIRDEEVVLELTADFEIECYSGKEWQTLSGAVLTPEESDPDRPSVIIRRADRRTLWEIAKKNRSTVDQICGANHISGDPVNSGTLLLIPLG